MPLAILTGLPAQLLNTQGIGATGLALPGAGALPSHLPVFVPRPWLQQSFALDLFRAAVFLQCMHYAAALHVLPRLGRGDEPIGARMNWPAAGAFRLALAGLGAVLFVGFAASFGDARLVYGVSAAVHTWVEVPILILALVPRSSPVATPHAA